MTRQGRTRLGPAGHGGSRLGRTGTEQGRDKPSEAWPGSARQVTARLDRAWQDRTGTERRRDNTSEARRGRAGHGTARRGRTGHGRSGQGRNREETIQVKRGLAGQVMAGRGMAWQDRTGTAADCGSNPRPAASFATGHLDDGRGFGNDRRGEFCHEVTSKWKGKARHKALHRNKNASRTDGKSDSSRGFPCAV